MPDQHNPRMGQPSWATFSDDGKYRYLLGREWGTGPLLAWVMLNPSTADAAVDDPTIRRCRGFTERWSLWLAPFGGMVVLNLFSYRATDPKTLAKVEDLYGPDHASAWDWAFQEPRVTGYVAAWGAHKAVKEHSLAAVRRRAEMQGKPAFSLGWTASGAPRHPLYVPAKTDLVRL